MRIAHATDIHWTVPAPLGRLASKRFLGVMNQVVGGRGKHFERRVQQGLVDHLVGLSPDLVVITGDLTTTALDEEFALAREELAPVLQATPTFIIPGNHDLYTRGAQRESRIVKHFGPWMHGNSPHGPVTRLDLGPVTVLGLDPNRAHVLSSGWLPDSQLRGLADALRDPALDGQVVVLAIHYPILDRRGAVYDGLNHGLRNGRALIEVLRQAPRRPHAILHGHEHHGFTVGLDLGDVTIPIYDCGSSGYAFLPEKRRAAAMNVYHLEAGRLAGVERYLWQDAGFAPEPGGAYATGR